MKSIALAAISISILVFSVIAYGQGSRGFSGRGFVSANGNTTTSSQTRQATGSSNVQITPARNVSTAPGTQLRISPQAVAPRVLTPRSSSTVVVATASVLSSRPRFVMGSVPPHHHLPQFFHRRPGIVIVDWPYVPTTTVITQIAPGVMREERRYLENPPAESTTRSPGQLAPFDPTPQEIVERILILASIKPGDVLYDLGSGDGRVAISAAKKYGIKAVGFEIDAGLVKLARENARKQGVEKLVEFRQQDFLTADLSAASVVTLYLSYDGNLALRSQLMQQLKSGARVVSYTFDMGEWQPKIAEAYRDAGGDQHLIYLWQIGEALAFR